MHVKVICMKQFLDQSKNKGNFCIRNVPVLEVDTLNKKNQKLLFNPSLPIVN